jgi:hypothetical protein
MVLRRIWVAFTVLFRAKDIKRHLLASNVYYTKFPIGYPRPGISLGDEYRGVVKRWTLPVPVDPMGDKRAYEAIEHIESLIPQRVFIVDTDLRNRSEDRGIVFSIGTARGKKGQPEHTIKGHVGRAREETEWPHDFLKSGGEISTRFFVSLDREDAPPEQLADTDIAIHELGHALGLFGEFQGFGKDGSSPAGPMFDAVLTLLYKPDVVEQLAANPSLTAPAGR